MQQVGNIFWTLRGTGGLLDTAVDAFPRSISTQLAMPSTSPVARPPKGQTVTTPLRAAVDLPLGVHRGGGGGGSKARTPKPGQTPKTQLSLLGLYSLGEFKAASSDPKKEKEDKTRLFAA